MGRDKDKAFAKKELVLAPVARAFDLPYDSYHPKAGGTPPERSFRLFACGFDLLAELLIEPDGFPSVDKGLCRKISKDNRKNLLWGGSGASAVLAHAIPALFARMADMDDPISKGPGSMPLSAEHHIQLRKMLTDFYPLKWKQMAHDDILIDCLAAFDQPGGETLSFLVEETKAGVVMSSESKQLEAQVEARRRKQAGKDLLEKKGPKHPRPALAYTESVDQVLMRPPKVDETQFTYARDFFINQASVIALEFAMIRQRTSFGDIEDNVINLTPTDDPEVLAYRERALQAWIRGTRTYWECARNEFSPDVATAEGSPV